MATAKKPGLVDRMKGAITGMFSSDSPEPSRAKSPARTVVPKKRPGAETMAPAKKAATKKTAAKKVPVKKAVAKKVAARETPTKKIVAQRSAAKKTVPKKLAAGKSASQDRKLIALTQPYEVRDWCASLGCTEAELVAAVGAVGHSAAKVREYLAKR